MSKDPSMRVPSSFSTFAEANSFAREKRGAVLIPDDTGFVVWLPKGGSSLGDGARPAEVAPPEEASWEGPANYPKETSGHPHSTVGNSPRRR